MYLFKGNSLTDNLVNHLHREIGYIKQLIINNLTDLFRKFINRNNH